MKILYSRLLTVSAPQWPKAQCEGWAAQVEALRQPYEAAVETHRPTEAAATIAEVGYRSAVRDAQARLRAFKRDLQNLGLTEAKTHDIIPDASVAPGAAAAKSPNGSGASGGGPEASSGGRGRLTAGGGKLRITRGAVRREREKTRRAADAPG